MAKETLMLAFLLFAISIFTNFDGGSLGKVEHVTKTHLRCAVIGEVDQDKRNRQASWYYFRLDGGRGRTLTIDLVDLPGEYNYQPNRGAITEGMTPFYSEDQKVWKPLLTSEYDKQTPMLRVKIRPRKNSVWIAALPPYTHQHLKTLLAGFAGRPELRTESVGKTVGGREMTVLTVTDPATPEAGKKVVWLMARQHAWESYTSWVCEGALRFLLSSGETARRIRRETIFKIFPVGDPDGVARGGVRYNANGFDLNRNWDAEDSDRIPEITTQRRAVLAWLDGGHKIDLFLTMHNTDPAEYLDGPPASEPEIQALTERFYQTLTSQTTFSPTRRPHDVKASTTEGMKGRMNVVQGLYHGRKIPGFLLEQRVSHNPKLNRIATVEDRLQFGAGLVEAIWRTVNK
jgi:hypothetical protein